MKIGVYFHEMEHSSRRIFGIVLLGCLILTGVYWPHFSNGYHFDDSHAIVENAAVQSLTHWKAYFTESWTSTNLPLNRVYRPLVVLSFALEYAVFNRNEPWLSHLTNYIAFLMILALLGWISFRLLRLWSPLSKEHAQWGGLIAAFLFGFHTVHAETLNYLISRSDIFSTLFVLMAFAVRLRFRDSKWRYLETVPLLLGVLSKQTAAMYPFWVFGFEWVRGTRFQERLKEALPTFVIAASVINFGIWLTSKEFQPGGLSVWKYLITQPYVLLRYVKEFLLPTELSADTDWSPFRSPFELQALLGFLFLAELIWQGYKQGFLKNGNKLLGFGVFSFLTFHVPTSSLIPLAEVTNDHRMFLPDLGLVWATLALGMSFYESRKPAPWVLGCILLLWGVAHTFGIRARTHLWSSDELLWKDVTEKSPRNGRGWMNYGLAQMERGDYTGADASFSEGLKLWPRYAYLKINSGVLREAQKRYPEAEAFFREAIQDAPQNPLPVYYYAHFLWKRGRVQEALPLMEDAVTRSQGYLLGRRLLIFHYAFVGDEVSSERIAKDTLKYYPQDGIAQAFLEKEETVRRAFLKEKFSSPALINLGLEAYRVHEYQAALYLTLVASELNTEDPTLFNNLCSYYIELKEWEKARQACDRALVLKPDFERAKNNRALIPDATH